MGNKSITSRDVDYAKWYTDVVTASKLCDYSSVKGSLIYEANGYAVWEKMQAVLDAMFKKTGHKNVYMPLLIPESLFAKEKELITGFAPEVAWVTQGGSSELEEKLAIRPTSETLFSDYFSKKVTSYRDLPLKLNQWVNVLRWEKETRPFLRGREFLWQEGHTVHETQKEAEDETLQMLNIYKQFFEEYLAIPVITGKKTKLETFAGAEYSYTIETLTYNGVALQSGTSHYFGQKFAKAYDIAFKNRENELEYAYQTSWGVTTRMIGALICTHSDDYGLVLPPKVAPTQCVIVPIGKEESLMQFCDNVLDSLTKQGITCIVDNSQKSPGFKFAEHEVNGVPIRVEIGMRDLENKQVTLARRDTRERVQCAADNVVESVVKLLDDIQNNLYDKAKQNRDQKTFDCFSLKELECIMDKQPGFVRAMWCGDDNCELKVKEVRGTKSRCIIENAQHISDKCFVCGKKAKHLVFWGIQY